MKNPPFKRWVFGWNAIGGTHDKKNEPFETLISYIRTNFSDCFQYVENAHKVVMGRATPMASGE